jgi:branched-chain amino acid transport system substrate-binding protein
MSRSRAAAAALVGLSLVLVGCVTADRSPASSTPSPSASSSFSPDAAPIHVGAVFPLGGNAAGLARQALAGVQLAADFTNADGGVAGRPIVLDVADLEGAADAPAAVASLRADGADVVIGAYSSDLSIAASAAADAAGLVYWEAGAVADRLTGRGLPMVFRVGASGTNLGSNSARFAAAELAPRLGVEAGGLRVAIVSARDAYAGSVADSAAATAADAGLDVVSRTTYDLAIPDWPALMAELAAARPSVVILASHIPDGVAFRQAMLAAGLKVDALIGSTMAECDPDFAGDLGPDAIGIFASDRPTGGFRPDALDPAARALYDRFASAWALSNVEAGGPGPGEYPDTSPTATDEPEYEISGPIELGTDRAGPTEESLSGFAAAWTLFHDVLPDASAAGKLDAAGIAAAARALDLPSGSLPNGAGVKFSVDPATLGQNERAAAVIWQWQAVRSYTFVWPPTYATGTIGFVPLSR